MKSELPAEGNPSHTRRAIYLISFLSHIHELVEGGYLAIRTHDYSKTDEETISGDLAEAIGDILDQRESPWMQFYDIHNEHPVQQSHLAKQSRTREGKKRQKIDIEFVSSELAPRLRFSYEAKRLHDSNSVSAYVGPEGLGCFVHSEYGANDSYGGMLGFVQKRTLETWSKNIVKKMSSLSSKLRSPSSPGWKTSPYSVANFRVKESHHNRSKKEPITIFHTFLDFRQQQS